MKEKEKYEDIHGKKLKELRENREKLIGKVYLRGEKLTFNFRLDKEHREKLDLIAKKYRRSRADVIRLMIEEEAVENSN